MVLSSSKSKRRRRLSRRRPNMPAPLQNPTRRRATTGRVPADEHGGTTPSPRRSPTSPFSPPDPLPQTQTSPSPPSDRRKPVRRLPSQPRPGNSHQGEYGPPVPATPQAPPPSQDASKFGSLRSKDSKGKGKTAAQEEKPKLELSISLTEEEVKKDFIAMTGSKPPRRPKRRQRSVQRDINSSSSWENPLQAVLPGSQLPKTVTPDRYHVPGPSC